MDQRLQTPNLMLQPWEHGQSPSLNPVAFYVGLLKGACLLSGDAQPLEVTAELGLQLPAAQRAAQLCNSPTLRASGFVHLLGACRGPSEGVPSQTRPGWCGFLWGGHKAMNFHAGNVNIYRLLFCFFACSGNSFLKAFLLNKPKQSLSAALQAAGSGSQWSELTFLSNLNGFPFGLEGVQFSTLCSSHWCTAPVQRHEFPMRSPWPVANFQQTHQTDGVCLWFRRVVWPTSCPPKDSVFAETVTGSRSGAVNVFAMAEFSIC